MTKPKITVLTDPIPSGILGLVEFGKKLARPIKNFLKPPPHYMRSKYRGHPAVTRSLVEGLQKIGYPHNYNPRAVRDCADDVLVLSGAATLKQAIDLKRKGRIKLLLAGPNILELPTEHGGLIGEPEVDFCVVPCDWVADRYVDDLPSLEGRTWIWPAGVDTAVWTPDRHPESRETILIYEKQRKGPVGPIEPYASYLQSLGAKVEVIRAGYYSPDEFLAALRRSALMVGFVMDESQGLAWAEAWSCDVPTLIWRNTYNRFERRPYPCSTAPYLTDQTGLFFDNLDDFRDQYAHWSKNRPQFRPRDWVLANMSDEVCAQLVVDKTRLVADDGRAVVSGIVA